MSDIVERLRDWLDEDKPIGVIMNEAADTIERLRVELTRINRENDRLTRTNRAKREHRDKLLAAGAKAADEIERLRAALREYACKCKNPHTGCAVEFDRSGNARCGWEARAALGGE